MNDNQELDWEKDDAFDDWLGEIKPPEKAKEKVCLMHPM